MAVVKRLFIKEGTDPKALVDAVRKNKAFTLERQGEMLKYIMESGFDRMVIAGVKRRRIRKKILKREIQNYKTSLEYKVLDFMVREYRDVPVQTPEQKRLRHEAMMIIFDPNGPKIGDSEGE